MPPEDDDHDVMCEDCGAPHGPGDPCRCNALCHQDGNHHLCKSCGGTGMVGVKPKSQVRHNAEKDPSYCPYCMRCAGLVRMVKVQPFLWGCLCGAVHDERDQ